MSITIQDLFQPAQFERTSGDEDNKKIEPLINFARSISELTYQSIYLVDYHKKAFRYVSDNPLFLCGNRPEEVLSSGYLFYLKNVPEKDLRMLLKINEGVSSFFKKIKKEDRSKYVISYDFHLKHPEGNLLLINHKSKPILLDRCFNPWIMLCLVSISPHSEAGHVQFKSSELKKCYDFHLDKNEWSESKPITLNKREKEILLLSAQGLTMEKIASKLFLSTDTIKFHKKNFFAKLAVKSISEAITSAIDLSLI